MFHDTHTNCLDLQITWTKIIKKSVGPSGPNIIYFRNLVQGLKNNDLLVDDYLANLEKLVEK